MDKQSAVSITASAYQLAARSWHEAHRDEDRESTRAESYDRFAARVRPAGHVLDIGCGSGLDAAPLARRGLRVTGLDIAPAMLSLAAQRRGLLEGVVAADLRALPFRAGAFDGALAIGSLHHLPRTEIAPALAETRRVLMPGGILSASVELGDGDRFVQEQDGVEGPRWYSLLRQDAFLAMLRAAGFAVLDVHLGDESNHTGGFIAVIAQANS